MSARLLVLLKSVDCGLSVASRSSRCCSGLLNLSERPRYEADTLGKGDIRLPAEENCDEIGGGFTGRVQRRRLRTGAVIVSAYTIVYFSLTLIQSAVLLTYNL